MKAYQVYRKTGSKAASKSLPRAERSRPMSTEKHANMRHVHTLVEQICPAQTCTADLVQP
eukprot:scaffold75167_cov19-Tisochrysis_lutea.AAC.2